MPITTAWPRMARIACASPLPLAWAVKPMAPIRRNPNPQNRKLKIMAPTLTAPRNAGSGRCPMTAVSTMPSAGTVRLDTMSGHDSVQTRRNEFREAAAAAAVTASPRRPAGSVDAPPL